jgi:hypothetical protein
VDSPLPNRALPHFVQFYTILGFLSTFSMEPNKINKTQTKTQTPAGTKKKKKKPQTSSSEIPNP